MIQCHKTEWVKQAIELNKYNSEQYMWIDFGIYQFMDKLIYTPDDRFSKFTEGLYQLENQYTRSIRMPQMWNLAATCFNFNQYIKEHICWYFGGSLYGAQKLHLKFAEFTKQQCLKMILNDSWLVLELNIWYLVYREHPDLFETYRANNDLSIITGYKYKSIDIDAMCIYNLFAETALCQIMKKHIIVTKLIRQLLGNYSNRYPKILILLKTL